MSLLVGGLLVSSVIQWGGSDGPPADAVRSVMAVLGVLWGVASVVLAVGALLGRSGLVLRRAGIGAAVLLAIASLAMLLTGAGN